MSCKRVRESLYLYCGGELDGAGAARVRGHLERCPACRAELERIERARGIAVDALRRLEAPGYDTAFWAGVEERIASGRRHVRPARRPAPWWLTLPAAAALVALVAVGVERSGTGGPAPGSVRPARAAARPPVVESVHATHVTVMTFETDDPRITIAWFFEEETERR